MEKICTHGRTVLDLRLQNKVYSYSCCTRNVFVGKAHNFMQSSCLSFLVFLHPLCSGCVLHARGCNWSLNFPVLKSLLPSIYLHLKKTKRNKVAFQISYILCCSLKHPLFYVLLLPICEHKVCNFSQVIESKLLYQYFQTFESFGIIDCTEDIQWP